MPVRASDLRSSPVSGEDEIKDKAVGVATEVHRGAARKKQVRHQGDPCGTSCADSKGRRTQPAAAGSMLPRVRCEKGRACDNTVVGASVQQEGFCKKARSWSKDSIEEEEGVLSPQPLSTPLPGAGQKRVCL